MGILLWKWVEAIRSEIVPKWRAMDELNQNDTIAEEHPMYGFSRQVEMWHIAGDDQTWSEERC